MTLLPALDIAVGVAHTSTMTSPDHYTPPSFKGAIVAIVLAVIGIAIVWWAFANVIRF